MDTTKILADLHKERDRIDTAIAALEDLNVTPTPAVSEQKTGTKTAAKKGKRTLSLESRAKMAEAAKARWKAKKREAKKAAKTGVKSTAKKSAAPVSAKRAPKTAPKKNLFSVKTSAKKKVGGARKKTAAAGTPVAISHGEAATV